MLSQRFDDALVFASDLHRSQTRKQTAIPYVAHLLAVAGLVLENGGGEDEAIAALLHDSLEDQGDRYPGGRDALRAEIRSRFGPRVLAIVEGCTDDDRLPKGAADTPELERQAWRKRKEDYLRHVAHADAAVLLVSCADKLHNLRTVVSDYRQSGDSLWGRFRTRSREDQLWWYGQLVRVFQSAEGGALSLQLAEAFQTLTDACGGRQEP